MNKLLEKRLRLPNPDVKTAGQIIAARDPYATPSRHHAIADAIGLEKEAAGS
jgi:hypothetical protein